MGISDNTPLIALRKEDLTVSSGESTSEMNSMRRWCYAITVMFVALTLADLEEVAQVERLRDTLDSSLSPADEKGRYYNKIPGFSMTAGATPYPEEVSREGCQSKCSLDPECKSYSWRVGADKACLTSTEALSYDSAYNLYVQSKTKAKRTYREFPGLVYRATGWVEKVGIAATECQKVCDSMDACAAFSYTIPNDDVSLAKCLLSGKAISYSPGFNYYEKKGVKISTSTADGEATVPTAEEKQKVSPVMASGIVPEELGTSRTVVNLFQAAAEKGEPTAQYNLANMLL